MSILDPPSNSINSRTPPNDNNNDSTSLPRWAGETGFCKLKMLSLSFEKFVDHPLFICRSNNCIYDDSLHQHLNFWICLRKITFSSFFIQDWYETTGTLYIYIFNAKLLMRRRAVNQIIEEKDVQVSKSNSHRSWR